MSDSALLEDPSTGATKPKTMKSKQAPRATAESMAAKQRDISVSEFFAKNRHLLGFDNPRKALLTTVKEAVDNSLDACEEAGILPDITVIIEDLQPDRSPSSARSRRRPRLPSRVPTSRTTPMSLIAHPRMGRAPVSESPLTNSTHGRGAPVECAGS